MPMVPVLAAFRRAFLLPWEQRAALAPATAILLLAQTIFWAAADAVFGRGADGNLEIYRDAMPVLAAICVVVATINLAYGLGLYRRVLLDEPRQGLGLFVVDRRLLLAIGTGVKIWLLAIAVTALATTLEVLLFGRGPDAGGAGAVVALIAFSLLLFPRLRLAFAAIAIDDPDTSLRTAWQRSQGNSLRLAGLTALLYCSLSAAQEIVGLPVTAIDPTGWVVLLLAGLAATLQVVVPVVSMALVYDVLVRGGGPRQLETWA